MIKLDEPRRFNEYIQSLKEDLLVGKLGGNRQHLWSKVKSEKVGLISYDESEVDQIENIRATEVENVSSSNNSNINIIVF